MVPISDKDPSSDVSNLPPVGSVEEASLTSTQGVGTQPVDKLSSSEQADKTAPASNADQPTLSKPDSSQLTQEKLQAAYNFIQNNPWFAPSFLACFTAVLMELLNAEKTIHYNEAQTELKVRSKLLEMAKTSASLAKQLQDNQAKEQMVQAITAFANAAVSAIQFAQTCHSMNTAKAKVEGEIKQKEADIQTESSKVITVADPNNAADLATARQVHTDKVKLMNKELEDMKANKETNIYKTQQNHDMQIQQLGQVMTQTLNGVAAVLQANIKSDTGRKEELQKLTEGFMQAFNKFSDTTTKQRDDAKDAFNRFNDFLMRITESVYKAHQLKG